jgi:hypothetical protein
MGIGLIVLRSTSSMDGAALGGRSLAGRKGKRDGGGLQRRLIARTE